jgi:hypothetical protein
LGSTSKNTLIGRYQGHLRRGKKHGWGHYYWPSVPNASNIEYEGQFIDDRISGKGKIIIGKLYF